MTTRLHIDLDRIRENSSLVCGLLAPHGIRLTGVTKACLGDERIAGAMLGGGAGALADSRPESLARLRSTFPAAELHLMRTPAGAGGAATGAPDLFFVSSHAHARAFLSQQGPDAGPVPLCLMLETGDGREGSPPEEACEQAAALASLPGARLAGVATNAACARPEAPLPAAMERFTEIIVMLQAELGIAGGVTGGGFEVVSAGGSGLLRLLAPGGWRADGGRAGGASAGVVAGGRFFDVVTDLRCGEAILLGSIPSGESPEIFLPGAHRDAFILEAQVLEVFRKEGSLQALAGMGLQDTGRGAVTPLDPGVRTEMVTSDYLVVKIDAEESPGAIPVVGGRLRFLPTYYALLAAMTSPFVQKVFRGAD